jgi:hypothetical protein
MEVLLKRAYEKPARADGFRVLVDRLWPRGIKKTDLRLNAWVKEIAPSTELRKWFNHDPKRGHAVAEVQTAWGARSGLIYLRAAHGHTRDVRRDCGDGDESRRNLCPVRDDDAVSGNGGFRSLGKGADQKCSALADQIERIEVSQTLLAAKAPCEHDWKSDLIELDATPVGISVVCVPSS